MSDKQKLNELREMLTSVERTLFAARQTIAELSGEKPMMGGETFLHERSKSVAPAMQGEEGRVVEGIFDGQSMRDPGGKTYPVPANYASKSKLVVGDQLKLTITMDGKFVYKPIGPVPRKNVMGPLTLEEGQYKVLANGKEYKVLMASITFYKPEVGEEVSVLVPEEGDADWGAFDAVIPHGQ